MPQPGDTVTGGLGQQDNLPNVGKSEILAAMNMNTNTFGSK